MPNRILLYFMRENILYFLCKEVLMMKKRWLSLILVLALCLCLLPAGAGAAEAPDETVTISYTLTDSYGDGWSFASIQIKEMSSGATVAELTVSNGSSSTGTVDLTVGTTYQFIWKSGSYDSECSYVFQNGSTVILEGAGGSAAGTLLTWTAVPPAGISVTVGNGSAVRQYVPTYSFYNYSKSQVLVPAAELSALAGRSITGITYYPAAGSYTRTLAVLLSETEAESMTALLDASSDTEVFAGSVSFQKDEEVHLAFDTPYPYKGGNLLVTVMDNTGSWQSGLSFYGVDRTGASWSWYTDNAPIPRSETGSGSARNFLPKMTFTADDTAPETGYDLWIAGVQVTSANAGDLTAIPGVSVEQGGKARYDPESNTLTLNGAHINNTLANPGEEKLNCGIYYDETEALNISVTGSNTVTSRAVASGDSRYETCGLWLYSYAALNVTLNSGATLSILGGGSAVNSASYGLEVNGPLTVSGSGELICNGGSAEAGTSIGIGAVNDITIGDGCSVSANCGTAAYSRGLYLIGTSRTIRLTGSAELNCSGGSGTNSYGVWYLPSLFSSGTLTLSAPDWTGAMTVTGQTKAMHAEEHAGTLTRTVSQMDMTGYVESDGTALSEASYNINEDLSGYKLISFAPTPVTTYDLYVAGVQVTSANAGDLSVIDGVTLGAEGYAKYYSTNNTLTIKNATITNSTAGEYGFGIQYTGTGKTFTLEAAGTNTVSVSAAQTQSSAGIAVGTPGDWSTSVLKANLRVYLLDNATLNATGGVAEGDHYPASYGIANAYDGQLTVTGAGTVNAEGGAGDYSYGVSSLGDFFKTGACTLNATGAADCAWSAGIAANGQIVLSTGAVNAFGGTSSASGAESYGIFGDSSGEQPIIITENVAVLARGGTSALNMAPTPDSGVTAGGSANIDGSGAVAYVSGDNDSYRWFAAPFAPPAPGPIETVTADAAPGRVRLSWTAAENATAYLIQRRAADSTAWTTLRSGITNTAWSDTSGVVGTVYQYRVRPMNGSVYGSFRASSVVRFLSGETPAPVENVTATAQAGRIVLTWSAAQNAEQYLVQRRVKDTEDWTTLKSNVTGLRYEDTTGEEGVVYQYRVRGRIDTLYGPFRVSSVARFYLYETPGSISSLTAKAEGGAVTVSWTAAENAAQYIIQRRVKGDTAWTTLKSNVSGLSYEDSTGEAGVVYQYRVRGRNHTVYGPFRLSSVVRFPQPTR
jgi:hypothetical protein